MPSPPITEAQVLAELHPIIAAFCFGFGLIWGSFLNVCIYRIPAKKSVVVPGSHCGSCGSAIAWYDNVPVLSWLWLRGQCRQCGEPFSFRYLGVELLTGLLFLAAYMQTGLVYALAAHAVFIAMLVVGIFTDIDHYILPNRITLGGAAFAVVASTLLANQSVAAADFVFVTDQLSFWLGFGWLQSVRSWPGWQIGLVGSLFGAAIGYLMLQGVAQLGYVLFRKNAMGGGDIKLFAFLGAYLGAVNSVIILFLAAALGSIVGVSTLAAHSLVGKDEWEEVELTPLPSDPSAHIASPSEQPAASQIAAVTDGESETSAAEPEVAVPAEPISTEPQPIRLRIARRTSHQLHQLPFGPYIAVAAILVLLFQLDVRQWVDARLDVSGQSIVSLQPVNPFPKWRLLQSVRR